MTRKYNRGIYCLTASIFAFNLLFTGCSSFTQRMAQNKQSDTFVADPKSMDPGQVPKNAKITFPKDEKPTPRALVDFAQVQMTLGRNDGAEEMLKRAIKADKNYVPAYCALSQVYMLQERTDKALENLEKVPKKIRSSALILNEKAIVHCKMKNYDVAEELLREALDQEPESEVFIMNLAGVLAVSGDFDEAYKLYSSKVGSAEARFRLAGVLFDQGKTQASRQQLELALKINPKHEKSAAMLVQMQEGQATVKPASYVVPMAENSVESN